MIRALWGIPLVFVSCAACATVAVVASPFDPATRVADVCAWVWARCTRLATGLKLSTVGRDAVDTDRSYVIVTNHQSHLDTICFLEANPTPVRMLAKAFLFSIPFLGWAMARMGHIPVYRGNTSEEQFERIAAGVGRLVKYGQSLVVFAEGSRTADGSLGEFKKGAFHLAKDFGLPILPVAVDGTFAVMPRHRFSAVPGTATLTYLPAIETEAGEVEELRDRTRAAIAEALSQSANV